MDGSPSSSSQNRNSINPSQKQQRRVRVFYDCKSKERVELMRPTTIQRHRLIREEFNRLAGTMPLLQIYIVLGEKFAMSDEYIRKILHKKAPP